MHLILACFAILFILLVAEVFIGKPKVISNLRDYVDANYPRSYRHLLFLPLAFTLAAYGVATVVGLYTGFAAACMELGTMCGIIFLVSIPAGIASGTFARLGKLIGVPVPTATGRYGPLAKSTPGHLSFLFLFGLYGSLALIVANNLGV